MIAGRYLLDREIGRGGMGAVYLARDQLLGRAVAIKRIGLLPGGGSPDLDRAAREAQLAARLNHPHVVAVYDLVHDGDQRWLVMEYVEGATLAALVRSEGPMRPDRIAPILAQAAEALSAAHAAGVVHRDVKPSNILVTADQVAKISDFGIARAEADASLTQTGLVTGSPAYLAPEIAQGRTGTPASDVWSFGATLLHALDGEPPFEVGDNVLAAMYRIVHEPSPRPAGAGWLMPLLDAVMVTDPAGRWTMAQVATFLRTGRPAGGDPPIRSVPSAPAGEDATATRTIDTRSPADAATRIPSPAPPEPPEPAGSGRRWRRGLLPYLAAAAVVVVGAALVLGVFGIRGSESPTSQGPNKPSPSASSSTAGPPTERGMERFVRDYLRTASTDSAAGFAMLTPAYQKQSQEYADFWTRVDEPKINSIEADPGRLVVRYNYSYRFDGGAPRSEQVTLRLTYRDGTYLIAGTA